jgi:hypothetical protein
VGLMVKNMCFLLRDHKFKFRGGRVCIPPYNGGIQITNMVNSTWFGSLQCALRFQYPIDSTLNHTLLGYTIFSPNLVPLIESS